VLDLTDGAWLSDRVFDVRYCQAAIIFSFIIGIALGV